jgi:two-component system, cell cycle response regulator
MKKKILIVDDEEDVLQSLEMLLNDKYRVTTTNNGIKALEILKSKHFDLIILDVLMPEMSGIEVAVQIRKNKNLKKNKIAFLSVVTFADASKKELEEINPVAYFQKPTSSDELIRDIEKIFENK